MQPRAEIKAQVSDQQSLICPIELDDVPIRLSQLKEMLVGLHLLLRIY
jgi:hypothetical protein